MEFNKAIDGLPKIVKILIAIFLDIIFVIYRLIADVTAKRTDLIILDILLAIFPIPFVFWILNLVWIIAKDQVFSFGEWVKGSAQ